MGSFSPKNVCFIDKYCFDENSNGDTMEKKLEFELEFYGTIF